MSDAGKTVTLHKVRGFIFDLDGTLYAVKRSCPVLRSSSLICAAGLPYLFVTNNSTTTPVGVAAALDSYGD